MDEKIIVDYSDPFFKGAQVFFPYLDEGFKHVQKQKIKDVFVRQRDEKCHTVSFDFLENCDFIEKFHWMVNISKKSNVSGLYYLLQLREFRWLNDCIPVDFARLSKIEVLHTFYYDGLLNLDALKSLKEFLLDSVKTNDLSFFPELDNLEYVRIINGRFTSISGLERCKNLKELDLRNCHKLSDANSTLQKLPKLVSVRFDGCKKHDLNVDELRLRIPHVWAD